MPVVQAGCCLNELDSTFLHPERPEGPSVSFSKLNGILDVVPGPPGAGGFRFVLYRAMLFLHTVRDEID